jgi:hypothetical protein
LSSAFESGSVIAQNTTLFAKWSNEYSALPALLINLEDTALSDVNREDYVDARVTLTNLAEEEEDFALDNIKAEFRGRGNSSWWMVEKKGYRIKFDKKQSLFGLQKSKHYVLYASSRDKSFSHNDLAFDIADQILDGIEYVSSHHYIDLYVNGTYHGVYEIFEQVRVDDGRVKIDSEYGENDTGYLIELDYYGTGTEGIDYFRVEGMKYPFMIKSPDPEEYAENNISEAIYRAQVEFIADYVQRVVTAALAQDWITFNNLADVDSFVDMYILRELYKNTDTGYSSFFLYKKPNGKLYAGPPWDFDIAAAEYNASPEGIYVGVGGGKLSYADIPKEPFDNEIFIGLMQTDDFVNAVKTRWAAIHVDIAKQIVATLSDEVLAANADAIARNNMLWYGYSDVEAAKRRYIDAAVTLRVWMLARTAWLSAEWAL